MQKAKLMPHSDVFWNHTWQVTTQNHWILLFDSNEDANLQSQLQQSIAWSVQVYSFCSDLFLQNWLKIKIFTMQKTTSNNSWIVYSWVLQYLHQNKTISRLSDPNRTKFWSLMCIFLIFVIWVLPSLMEHEHKYVKTKLKYWNFEFFVNGLFPHLSGGNLVNSVNPGSSDSCWWRCHLVEAVIPPVV